MFDQDRLRNQGQRYLPLLLTLWLVALIPAAKKLLGFEWTAGATGIAPSRLSGAGSTGQLSLGSSRDDHAPLLVVAMHPLCSCTRATLKELETSASTWKQPYRATFLIYKAKPQKGDQKSGQPSIPDFDWHKAAYIREAQQALHADVIEDINGEQAARLGAFTSGEILFYSAADAHGSRNLLFSGGVTAGRGMEGENNGISALALAMNSAAAVTPGAQSEAHSPVYGCGLAALSSSARGGSAK